jgi:uncharacterized protein YjbI with pentapeptide repeats
MGRHDTGKFPTTTPHAAGFSHVTCTTALSLKKEKGAAVLPFDAMRTEFQSSPINPDLLRQSAYFLPLTAVFLAAAALGAAAFFGAALAAAALGAAAFFGAALAAAALGAAAFFGAALAAAALGAAVFFGAATFLAAEAAGLAATVLGVAAFFGAAAAFEPVTFCFGMGQFSLKVDITALTVLIIPILSFCQLTSSS